MRYESGAQREETIRSYFWLVRKIARRIARMVPGSDVGDLVGDGSIGLIRAADSFDPSRARSFEGYAGRVIAGAMLNGLRRLDPVSERVRREIRRAECERYALAAQCGSLPSRREMESRRPALRRAAIHAYRYTPLSLDNPLPDGERLPLDWSGDPATIAGARIERDRVRCALGLLSSRQRCVLTLYYFRRHSLHQIGYAMGISPQRASQLHLAALRNLRKALHVAAAG